jgi:hypothetical protein
MVASTTPALLQLLDTLQAFTKDPGAESLPLDKKLAATIAVAFTELATVMTMQKGELVELRAHVTLLTSALLAGDTLVRGGMPKLLLPSTAELFEHWVNADARRAVERMQRGELSS